MSYIGSIEKKYCKKQNKSMAMTLVKKKMLSILRQCFERKGED